MSNFQSIKSCKQQRKDIGRYHFQNKFYAYKKEENMKEECRKIKRAGCDTHSEREKIRTVEPQVQSQIQKTTTTCKQPAKHEFTPINLAHSEY